MAGGSDPACPICGERNPKGARRCDNCGAALGRSEAKGAHRFADSREADDATARDLVESGYRPPEGEAKEGTPYLCPSCGGSVNSADTTCEHCGASLGEKPARSTADIAPATEAEGVPVVCSECGSLAPTGRQTCAVCGTPLGPAAVPPSPPPEPTAPTTPAPRPAQVVPKRGAPVAVPPPPISEAAAQRAGTGARPVPPVPRAAPPVSKAVSTSAPSAKVEIPPRPAARRSARSEDDRRQTPIARIRELVVLGTAVALPAAAGSAYVGVAGHEWGQLFLYGVLLGIGAALSIPDLRRLRPRTDALLFLAALSLLAAVPMFAYIRGPSAGTEAVLAVAAVALLAFVAWRQRADVGVVLPWIAGLLLLAALAYGPLSFLPAPGTGAALWGLGGFLVLGSVLLVGLRRWFRTATDGRLVQADRAYQRRDYEASLASYDAAIAVAKRSGRESTAGWYGRGAALAALGRHTDAIAALDRALSLDPENETAWINKGTALARLGRLSEALKCYNSAIKVNPSYEVAWNNKGNALARLGRHELAFECYSRALQIDPAYRTAWVNKGFVLAKLGRFEEAADCADTALRLTGGVPAAA